MYDSTHIPSDFLTSGEVEEHGSVHDVDLVGLCASDAVYSIFNIFKLNQSLPHAWHHGKVTAKKGA